MTDSLFKLPQICILKGTKDSIRLRSFITAIYLGNCHELYSNPLCSSWRGRIISLLKHRENSNMYIWFPHSSETKHQKSHQSTNKFLLQRPWVWMYSACWQITDYFQKQEIKVMKLCIWLELSDVCEHGTRARLETDERRTTFLGIWLGWQKKLRFEMKCK